MKYQGVQNFSHQQAECIGVLITNLGTPDEPTPKALKRYLKQFLWDPRVVEMPRPLWWLILNGVILNLRPRRSAQAYAQVWEEQGSPLLIYTRNQCRALADMFKQRHGERVQVDFAMRYGTPSIGEVVERMQQQGVRQLLVLPLFPQYSGATSGSTFDALAADFIRRRWLPDLRFVSHYHDFPAYIEAMASVIERHWAARGRADRLLLSYHGLPKRYLLSGDPYFCECHATSRLLADRLKLASTQYQTVFQSRFGREEWLQPYTDATLRALPKQGVKSVQVFCPGFSADCLETIEEIGIENRDYFLEAGGERYEYIPALNAEPVHIEALAQLIEQQIGDWLAHPSASAETRLQRARALGSMR